MKNNGKRIYFLDNLRSLMVILVLILHSGASYGAGVDFWPFHDVKSSGAISFFMFLCDVFIMAVIFFIAGYFALPSLVKKGTKVFIKDKLKQLGIPWFIITFFLLPVIDYIHYVNYNKMQLLPITAFPKYWLLSIKKIGEFHTGWMNMSTYLNMNESFYQRYMWFLSLLALFFIIFVFVCNLYKKIYKCANIESLVQKTLPKKYNFKIINIITFAMVLLFTIFRFTYPEFMSSGWFSVGNIFQFQLGKLFIYAYCFTIGIFAFSRKWFSDGIGIGKAWIWAIICFCLFAFNMLVLKNITELEKPLLGYKLAFCVIYPLWAISFAGFFISLAYKSMNWSSKFFKRLSENSYNMYLVHYVFPYSIPLLISNFDIPVTMKFSIVSFSTIVFSYIISRYIMKRLSGKGAYCT
jgi:surface polysaccharide O-acyltransferase-like enzyme